jgi:uncharacterized membrane protein (DUF106 family)
LKTFVLSTTNLLGGKNYFMAVCYLVVGVMCIIFSVVFTIAYLNKKSQMKKNKKKAKEDDDKIKKKRKIDTARTENDELVREDTE